MTITLNFQDYVPQWRELDSDGFIIVPYAFHEDYPNKDVADAALQGAGGNKSRDLVYFLIFLYMRESLLSCVVSLAPFSTSGKLPHSATF